MHRHTHTHTHIDRVLGNHRVPMNAAQLLVQLQREHQRIEGQYLAEAKATIDQEKALNAEMQQQVPGMMLTTDAAEELGSLSP